jgi:hypothetical protein
LFPSSLEGGRADRCAFVPEFPEGPFPDSRGGRGKGNGAVQIKRIPKRDPSVKIVLRLWRRPGHNQLAFFDAGASFRKDFYNI